VPPVEEAITRDRDLLITNPDPLPLGPDGHREPVAGPARNLAREERTSTVQRIDIKLWVALDQFAIGEMLRIDHLEKYRPKRRAPSLGSSKTATPMTPHRGGIGRGIGKVIVSL
jgi:hypothetical protein